MSRKRKASGLPRIEGDFVPLLKYMLKLPVWKDLQFGSRCLYTALKGRHNGKNNGQIYLSVREAAEELGASRSSVEVWFRDLESHGFIQKTVGAYLGVEGKAQAARWRLSEIGFMMNQPSREYLKWEPSGSKASRKSGQPKNNIPHRKSGQTVTNIGTPCHENRDTCHENQDGFGPNPPSDCPEIQCSYISLPCREAAAPPAGASPSVAGRPLDGGTASEIGPSHDWSISSASSFVADISGRLKRGEFINGMAADLDAIRRCTSLPPSLREKARSLHVMASVHATRQQEL